MDVYDLDLTDEEWASGTESDPIESFEEMVRRKTDKNLRDLFGE